MASSSALHTFRNTSRTSEERDAASTPDDRLGERLVDGVDAPSTR